MSTHQSVQLQLFDRLPVPSQAEVQSICQPYYPQLWHSIMEPWEEFLAYRASDRNFSDFTEGEAAQWLTIQATHRARRLFDGVDGVRFITPHQKLVIVLQEKLAVTIKKLRKRINLKTRKEEIVRSNYLTKRNQRVWNQERGEDSLNFPRIILGYMFEDEATQVSTMLAYPRSQRLTVEWVLPIPRQSALHSTSFAPRLATAMDDQPTLGFSLAPADARGEERDTGSE